jgi:hypothetical protein
VRAPVSIDTVSNIRNNCTKNIHWELGNGRRDESIAPPVEPGSTGGHGQWRINPVKSGNSEDASQILPDAVAFTLAFGRIVAHSEKGMVYWPDR